MKPDPVIPSSKTFPSACLLAPAQAARGEEAFPHLFQPQRAQHFLQALGRAAARQVAVLRNDQLVLHRMFPAHQLGTLTL
jgi:hypothetical protein